MPIHDPGYRSWDGEYQPRGWRWLVFTRVGISLALRSRWIKRLVGFGFLQAIAMIGILYAIETFVLSDLTRAPMMIRDGMQVGVNFGMWSQEDVQNLVSAFDPRNPNRDVESRYGIWQLMLLGQTRSPQLLLMVLLLGILTPPLIAYDIRSRGFLLFFSRPITPTEYVVGKSLIVWAFLFVVTAVPALLTYIAAVFLSPSLSVIGSTWDLPVRILLTAVCVAAPTTAISLCLSSITTESRKAGFAWFAIWAVGMTTYGILTAFTAVGPRGQVNLEEAEKWQFVSLFHTLGDVEKYIFGVSRTFGDVLPSIALLAFLTVGCYWVILRKVKAPMNV